MSLLDLRAVPTWERPQRILERFEQLTLNDSFAFATDFEPRALLMRLHSLHPTDSAWVQRQIGSHQWEVLVTKIDGANTTSSTLLYLRRTVFSAAFPATRDALAAAAKEFDVPKGTVIYEADTQWPFLGFLCEGLAAVSASAGSGRDRVLFEVLPFEPFGVIQVLDGGLAVGRCSVISRRARYLAIPVDLVHTLASQDVGLANALSALCAQRARSLVARLTAQVAQPTIVRIAAALLPYAAPERGMQPAMPPVATLTQTQLAAAAGTVKEVAARAIAELESNGALRRERGHVRHLDRNKLLTYVRLS